MSATPSPAVGDVAPEFALTDQYGQAVSLADFRGTKHVLLVFYPFAFSQICTGELQEIRDHLEDFEGQDLQVLAVSCDSVYAQRAWADAEAFFFPLLSDFWPHGAVASSYGVLSADTGFAVRGTFLVDREGVVRWTLVNGPGEARDFAGYRTALAELRAGV